MDRKIVGAILGLWITSSWTVAALAADASAGKAIFEKSCAGCHGPDGKGNEKGTECCRRRDVDVDQ